MIIHNFPGSAAARSRGEGSALPLGWEWYSQPSEVVIDYRRVRVSQPADRFSHGIACLHDVFKIARKLRTPCGWPLIPMVRTPDPQPFHMISHCRGIRIAHLLRSFPSSLTRFDHGFEIRPELWAVNPCLVPILDIRDSISIMPLTTNRCQSHGHLWYPRP